MSAPRDPAIGVDIGGTKIAAALVGPDGSVLESAEVPTPAVADRVAETVADLVASLGADHPELGPVATIGVGAAGFVDVDRSTVTFAPNIAWRDEPLGRRLEHLTGRSVVVENDANAAAWGEFRFGAGSDIDDMVLVTVGTGVGGGIVHRGELVRGGFGAAGEIGHLRVVRDGRLCGCGRRGCFEQYASGSALVTAARERLTGGGAATAALARAAGDPADVTGPMITTLAQDGDPLAIDLLAELGQWLGEGCADLVAVLDPRVIAIGGGVAAAGELLLEPVRAAFEAHLPAAGHRRAAEIRLATLGQRAGLLGAADLGRRAPTTSRERAQ